MQSVKAPELRVKWFLPGIPKKEIDLDGSSDETLALIDG